MPGGLRLRWSGNHRGTGDDGEHGPLPCGDRGVRWSAIRTGISRSQVDEIIGRGQRRTPWLRRPASNCAATRVEGSRHGRFSFPVAFPAEVAWDPEPLHGHGAGLSGRFLAMATEPRGRSGQTIAPTGLAVGLAEVKIWADDTSQVVRCRVIRCGVWVAEQDGPWLKVVQRRIRAASDRLATVRGSGRAAVLQGGARNL